jgi:hypothetical protein
MINLIPKEEERKMAVDFYSRLAVLFLLMLSFSVLAACVAILPAYFISSVNNSVVSTKLKMQKAQPLPELGEQSLATVKDINTKLGLVENAEKNKFSVSEKIVNAILLKKTPGVKIIQILYDSEQTQGKKINILGTATSRETLLSFQEALEDDPAFKNIDLPISNFVKVSNIQFDLSLEPV